LRIRYAGIRMTSYALLLASAVLIAPAAAAVPDAGAVTSITIDSTAFGLAGSARTHTVIRQSGDGFVRDDGTAVDADLIAALLDSLQGPHPSTVAAADVGITSATLRAQLSEAEGLLGDATADPCVRSAFERLYFDMDAAQRWVDRNVQASLHLDNYPSLSVTIVTENGTIAINSRSSAVFMLPMSVRGPQGAQDLYDDRIPQAIAALLPEQGANKGRLGPQSMLLSRASELADAPSVRSARGRICRSIDPHS